VEGASHVRQREIERKEVDLDAKQRQRHSHERAAGAVLRRRGHSDWQVIALRYAILRRADRVGIGHRFPCGCA
jgi:hypothetical protein